jgi:protein-tyrosine phosphatase
MAEGFLRYEAERRGMDIVVRSTGTHAWTGRAATFDGRLVMSGHGVPIDDHRTLELDRALVDWADIIFAMSREHHREVVRAYPDAARKTFTVKRFLELLPSLPPYEDTESWLFQAAGLADRAEPLADEDIEDPIGERREAYQRVAAEIKELIARMAEGFESKRVRLGA